MPHIIRYDPFRHLRRSLFDDSPWVDWLDDPAHDSMLKVDMYEEEDKVVVQADMPGVSPENVDISVTSENVTIKATCEEKIEEKQREYIRKERKVGAYARTINFPVQVVPEEADAEFKEGTLVLKILKEKKVQPKTVEVKVKETK